MAKLVDRVQETLGSAPVWDSENSRFEPDFSAALLKALEHRPVFSFERSVGDFSLTVSRREDEMDVTLIGPVELSEIFEASAPYPVCLSEIKNFVKAALSDYSPTPRDPEPDSADLENSGLPDEPLTKY